jgi:hypothetical protein
MKKIDVGITQHMYDVLLERFGSKRRVEEIASLKLEQAIKVAMNNEKHKDYHPRENITILIDEQLYTKFNDFCVRRNITKREFIMKKLRRLIE